MILPLSHRKFKKGKEYETFEDARRNAPCSEEYKDRYAQARLDAQELAKRVKKEGIE